MKNIILIGMLTILTSCGTSKLYKGETLPEDAVGKVWNTTIIGKPNGFVRILKLNSNELTVSGGREYALLPDEYNLEIVFRHVDCGMFCPYDRNDPKIRSFLKSGTTSYLTEISYRLKLKVEAGQTYVPILNEIPSSPFFEVCILGEPHNAVGHIVNLTKEHRYPSKNATLVACKQQQED